MFQNSKWIRSELFTVRIQEPLDFLGSSVLFLASGYQGPGFHFVCHVAFSADSLTPACGNRALLSIYTALSLHKDIFYRLRNGAWGPRVFKPSGVCFCSHRHYLCRGDDSSWSTLLTSLSQGLLDAATDGRALMSVWFYFLPCLLCQWRDF